MSRALVAYFSHPGMNYVNGNIIDLKKGNTQIIAEMIQRCVPNSDLFEIRSKRGYGFEYKECVKEAAAELKDDVRPELADDVDTTAYDVIFIGYPNWCAQAPMPVFTFIEGHDLSGKKIVPFCTHEGSGIGTTEKRVREACVGAEVLPGLGIHGAEASSSEEVVKRFVESLGLRITPRS